MARLISVLDVIPEKRRGLERRVGASTTAVRDCVRAHIVLLRSEGVGQQEVASRLGASAPSVSKWSQRFGDLRDTAGRGAKPSIPLATVRRAVEEAGKAPPGRQRWSARSLARELGIRLHSVARIWQRQGRAHAAPSAPARVSASVATIRTGRMPPSGPGSRPQAAGAAPGHRSHRLCKRTLSRFEIAGPFPPEHAKSAARPLGPSRKVLTAACRPGMVLVCSPKGGEDASQEADR